MSKFKISIVAGAVAFAAALGISMPAMADDPVIPNAADASIPITETVNAGASVDMNGITYTIDVAKQLYGEANTQHPTLTKGTGVYDDGATPLEATAPIVIRPAETTKTTDGDFTDVWNISRSLTELFGPASNFPRAGMYEYTIKQSHAGGSSTDTDKWEYDEPEFLLQVLVKTSTTNVTVLEYGGWTLSKWDADQGKYVKINSGGDDDPDGAAAFSETYKAKSQLNVTKQVSGDYASTTWQFPQTITVTLPEWYSEATDGAIQPRDGEPLAEGDVTITRKSTDGNTIVFETALAHGQTATLTVPVGTRYAITETSLVDGAGLSYSANIEWSVANGSISNTQESTNAAKNIAVVSSTGTRYNFSEYTIDSTENGKYVVNYDYGIISVDKGGWTEQETASSISVSYDAYNMTFDNLSISTNTNGDSGFAAGFSLQSNDEELFTNSSSSTNYSTLQSVPEILNELYVEPSKKALEVAATKTMPTQVLSDEEAENLRNSMQIYARGHLMPLYNTSVSRVKKRVSSENVTPYQTTYSLNYWYFESEPHLSVSLPVYVTVNDITHQLVSFGIESGAYVQNTTFDWTPEDFKLIIGGTEYQGYEGLGIRFTGGIGSGMPCFAAEYSTGDINIPEGLSRMALALAPVTNNISDEDVDNLTII